MAFCLLAWLPQLGLAQEPSSPILDAEQIREMLASDPDEPAAAQEQPTGIDILSLIFMGRWLMVPIVAMSMLVVTLVVERLFGLSRRRVVPTRLRRELLAVSDPIDRFDPVHAFRLVHGKKSSLARVVEAMLSRIGRPAADIEHVAAEVTQREADALGGPIRWLHLAAAVTPLMGLFGTVWGMIQAFHDLSQLPIGENKAEFLASGIYIALVTTVAGLAVAIPAAIAAHFFENRLIKLLRHVEETCFRIAPAMDRFAGRYRMTSHGELVPLEAAAGRPDGKDAGKAAAASQSSRPLPASITS